MIPQITANAIDKQKIRRQPEEENSTANRLKKNCKLVDKTLTQFVEMQENVAWLVTMHSSCRICDISSKQFKTKREFNNNAHFVAAQEKPN